MKVPWLQWLAHVDAMPLECDGATRAASTLLQIANVDHEVCVGTLEVAGAGNIDLHWWIVLSDGRVVDYRARMWLGMGSNIPHGVFKPAQGCVYRSVESRTPESVLLTPALFHILAGVPLDFITGTQSDTSTQ